MTVTVARLPEVDAEMRARITAAPRDEATHRALLAEVPALSRLETGGGATGHLAREVCVIAWNVERCLFPDAAAAHLAPHAPDVVLLSEMDNGMARTGQRHTTAELAQALGMGYVYGVEFFEIGLGGPTERAFCSDAHNARGFHGNAVLCRAAPLDHALIRLDDTGHWFAAPTADPDQPRIGGRMAVAVLVDTAGGPVCFATTHLESNAGVVHRAAQMARLLDGVEVFADGAPIVIGGDLNTGNHLPSGDWREEVLFQASSERGYNWAPDGDVVTTGPSLITPHLERRMVLDWFCTRGIKGLSAEVLDHHDPSGRPLSDHKPILGRFRT